MTDKKNKHHNDSPKKKKHHKDRPKKKNHNDSPKKNMKMTVKKIS